MVSQAALSDLNRLIETGTRRRPAMPTSSSALMTDDFTMGSLSAGAAGMRFSRDHVSRDQARHYFAELLSEWDLNFFHVRDLFVQASEVAVICECCWLHKRTRQVAHSPKLDLWKFKGRKAIGYFEFFDTEQAIAADRRASLPPRASHPVPLYAASPASRA